MKKYIVKKSDTEFIIILHASPNANYDDISFQWFLGDQEMKGQIYESYGISVSQFDNKYINKTVHCLLKHSDTGKIEETEKLTVLDKISKMINAGTNFDTISQVDQNGNII